VLEGTKSTSRYHRADTRRHLQAVPDPAPEAPDTDPQTSVSEDAAALDDALSDPVLMVASWGLRCASLDEIRELAERTGLSEDEAGEAIDLLANDRGRVAEHVRDTLQAAGVQDLPDYVTASLPEGAAS
jgi:hypothetical protein